MARCSVAAAVAIALVVAALGLARFSVSAPGAAAHLSAGDGDASRELLPLKKLVRSRISALEAANARMMQRVGEQDKQLRELREALRLHTGDAHGEAPFKPNRTIRTPRVSAAERTAASDATATRAPARTSELSRKPPAAAHAAEDAWPHSTFEPICQVTFGKAVCMQANQSVRCPEKPQAGAVPTKTGAWELPASYVYFLDLGLAHNLAALFAGASVTEFGAGKGCYTAALRRQGVKARAYDGSASISEQTQGLVQAADLTTQLKVSPSDWVLCLEVAEHIPREYEDVLLQNLISTARIGIVMSWSNNEGGNGHVNLRDNAWVIRKMSTLGFAHDAPTQGSLRKEVKAIHWFKDTILVFRRRTLT